jgi:hypothetical protein
MSVTEVIKNLVFGGWSGPPQPRIPDDAAQTAGNKLQFLEKDIPLPQELRLDNTRPVFDVLCEDAVMFYTVRQSTGAPNDSQTHALIFCSLFPGATRSNTHIGTHFKRNLLHVRHSQYKITLA